MLDLVDVHGYLVGFLLLGGQLGLYLAQLSLDRLDFFVVGHYLFLEAGVFFVDAVAVGVEA